MFPVLRPSTLSVLDRRQNCWRELEARLTTFQASVYTAAWLPGQRSENRSPRACWCGGMSHSSISTVDQAGSKQIFGVLLRVSLMSYSYWEPPLSIEKCVQRVILFSWPQQRQVFKNSRLPASWLGAPFSFILIRFIQLIFSTHTQNGKKCRS